MDGWQKYSPGIAKCWAMSLGGTPKVAATWRWAGPQRCRWRVARRQFQWRAVPWPSQSKAVPRQSPSKVWHRRNRNLALPHCGSKHSATASIGSASPIAPSASRPAARMPSSASSSRSRTASLPPSPGPCAGITSVMRIGDRSARTFSASDARSAARKAVAVA